MDLFSNDITQNTKKKLIDMINEKLAKLQETLLKHIDFKIDKIAENIAVRTINREMEEEVNRRVKKKLDDIKNAL